MDPLSIAGAAIGIAPTIAGWFTGGAQRRRARQINPVDPGFVANPGILDNKRIMDELYGNYTLPGRSGIESNLSASTAGGMAMATQGASSSGDIIDAAARITQGQNQAVNNLGIQQAEMKNGLLPGVMDANAQAGQQVVDRNMYDQNRYQQQLEEKAALTQAGAINQFKSLDNLATLGGTLLNYKAEPAITGTTRKRTYK